MSEQQMVRTVEGVEEIRSDLGGILRQVGTAALVMLILAITWFAARELLVFLLKDAVMIRPRFS